MYQHDWKMKIQSKNWHANIQKRQELHGCRLKVKTALYYGSWNMCWCVGQRYWHVTWTCTLEGSVQNRTVLLWFEWCWVSSCSQFYQISNQSLLDAQLRRFTQYVHWDLSHSPQTVITHEHLLYTDWCICIFTINSLFKKQFAGKYSAHVTMWGCTSSNAEVALIARCPWISCPVGEVQLWYFRSIIMSVWLLWLMARLSWAIPVQYC